MSCADDVQELEYEKQDLERELKELKEAARAFIHFLESYAQVWGIEWPMTAQDYENKKARLKTLME